MSTPQLWPDGIQGAVTVSVNFDGESVDSVGMELPLWGRYSHGRYGAQVGARNLLSLFARYDVQATFFIGAWDVERDPHLMDEIAASGHEIAGHGYRHEDFSALSAGAQEELLAKSEDIFQSTFGQKPSGFRAPERLMSKETREILIRRGYTYDSSYADDDIPYIVSEGSLVELPAHDPWSDRFFYEKHRAPFVAQGALIDEFLGTVAAGGLYNLMVHPRGDYGSGRGSRIRVLENVLQAIREQPRVWSCTCREVADWMLAPKGATT